MTGGEGYSIEVYEDQTTGFPFQNQEVSFGLRAANGASAVHMMYSFELKPGEQLSSEEADGLAGEIVEGVLDGLKRFAESGKPVEKAAV